MIKSIVSGYFNPIHRGHIEYINAAKMCGDFLVVIVNSDKQVKMKGSFPFMDEDQRLFIVSNLKSVDQAFIAGDEDKTVAASLRMIRENYPRDNLTFYNSGDRNTKTSESAEVIACRECNIKYIILDQPKIASSSDLIKKCKNESKYQGM
jgi:cytidyltransferase-like protein